MLIYYYTTFDHALDDLEQEHIRLSESSGFNDPFELFPIADSEEWTKESMHAFLSDPEIIERFRKEDAPQVPSEQFQKWYMDNLPERIEAGMPSLPAALELSRKNFAAIFNSKFRIGCFSKTPESTLMWSHYAAKHYGVVIGYDTTRPPINGLNEAGCLVPVDYNKERAVFRYTELKPGADALPQVIDIVKRKAPEWSYEEEVRLLCSTQMEFLKQNFMEIPPDTVSVVAYGHRITPTHKATLERLLKEPRYNHVAIYQAGLSRDKFAMDFSAIRETPRVTLRSDEK